MREAGPHGRIRIDEFALRELAGQGYSPRALARVFKVGPDTLYKRLDELGISRPVDKNKKPRKKEEEKMPDPEQPKCNECKKRAVAGGAAQSGESARKLGLCQRCWGIAGTAVKWRNLLGMKTRRPQPSKGGGPHDGMAAALNSLHLAEVQQSARVAEAQKSLLRIRTVIEILEDDVKPKGAKV